MVAKNFCDLCGKPALDPSCTWKTYKTGALNRIGYHLFVEFTEAKKHQPCSDDERKDCCAECMASGLESIASSLRKSLCE